MYFVVTWAALLLREGSHLPVGSVVCVVAHTLLPWDAQNQCVLVSLCSCTEQGVA